MPRSKLKKAVILIPLNYNDGSSIPEELLNTIYDELFDLYQGWTIEGTVRGAYQMQSGEKRVEQLVRVAVVLRDRELPDLENKVAQWASVLGQETMSLEITDSLIKFVSPRRKRRP
jgi:hypothetical protein